MKQCAAQAASMWQGSRQRPTLAAATTLSGAGLSEKCAEHVRHQMLAIQRHAAPPTQAQASLVLLHANPYLPITCPTNYCFPQGTRFNTQ
jgi:predicted metal-dependent HD superfamily phosphohydrolase